MHALLPAVVLTVLAALARLGQGQDRYTNRFAATRSEALGTRGMAATSQPLATLTAVDILRNGGNAIDAAIAANAVLCVTEPTGCGLGGDLFAIVWSAEEERLLGLNGSGRSPEALTLEHLRSLGLERIPAHGPLPVTVPGCVDGWFALHGRLGRLPMAAILAPAIRIAREGFAVTEVIAFHWARGAPRLARWPGFAEVFLPGGRPPRAGEVFRNPALAETLEHLARGGREAFYEGGIAERIADYMQAHGGFLSRKDLATHRSEWVEPVSTTYRGYEIHELPPNGQGLAVLEMLNLIEGYDVAAMGSGSADWLHLFVEAKKLAFEDRARWYADPAFAEIPVKQLASKTYAAQRRRLLDLRRAAESQPAGEPPLETGDTIYLAVADQDRNMVSLIQSNYRGFGSGMTPPGLGFCLQDRGELFDLREGRPNTYGPGKRPFHTIIPGFATKDGRPWLSFGVMGGAMQPQGHVQVLVNLIDFGMNLQEAGDAPRVRHIGSSQPTGERMTDGGTVLLESGFSFETRRELALRGHRLSFELGGFGGYQAILLDEHGVYHGASESRKDGVALGY